MTATNPLLQEGPAIPFHRIRGEHVEPGVREILRVGRERLEQLATDPAPPTFDNTLGALDDLTRWVAERLTPASHLLSVAETPELRSAYNEVLPEISQFWTRLTLHEGLWARLRAFEATDEATRLTGLARRHLEKTMLEFRRSGADLPPDRRARLEEIQVALSTLQQRFGEHVLDATAAWEYRVDDESRLDGVPAAARRRFRAAAKAAGHDGWLLTLDYPSVEPILKYARDRELRRTVFEAYTTRCRAGEYDNRPLVVDILNLRTELAGLLGYRGFPDYVLEDRMARDEARARGFTTELTERARPYWQRDAARLREHAATLGLDPLQPWDVSFVSEHLRRTEYDLDDEALRPWFPLDRVESGLWELARRVFGLTVEEREVDEVWHPDVRHYDIRADDGVLLGSFYTDWFPRKEKRQGAWMNDFRSGGPRPDGGFDPHLGVICGNFTPPEGDRPALLTHREVETLFHEFGHLLHHTTSRVPIRSRGGLNVAWDWVELPSQIMENWTWEREALDLFARHHETGEPLPDELFDRMVRARRFMGGWQMMRQLSFGTVDLELHGPWARDLNGTGPDELMARVEERFRDFSPAPHFARYHILTSFTHLFSGGYAAGYYSYLWSEVLEADAFSRFRNEGIFNRETGRDYMESILSRGDSDDPEALFRSFLGRDPDPQALLDRNLGPVPS
ncbi:M3 family metallopeptidase [Gaopeijia maritima]|uniref:M3 family metallopeptidase n=1 Tax=Gaopeijia maritima TaxID=3119007 RepID=UPI00386E7BFB